MNITLIFPPFSISYQPYSSLPVLTAYLKKKGCSVTQIDENIEFINYYLTKSFLTKIYKNDINDIKNSKIVKENYLIQRYISNCFKDEYFKVIEEIEFSLDIIKRKKFFLDLLKVNKARDIINKAQNILNHYIKIDRLVRSDSFDLTWDSIKNELKSDNIYKNYFRKFSLPKLFKYSPKVIGISIVFEDQIIPALILASEVKKKFKDNIHITLGGPVITILQENIKNNKEIFSIIDSCILYEGEYALSKLSKNIKLKYSFDDVPNLMYLKGQNIMTNETSVISDLNLLPTPDFEGLPLNKYFSPSLVPVLKTTRGCYWNKCTFCNNKFLNNNRVHRQRSAELIYEDFVKLHKTYNVNEFTLWEEAAVPKNIKKLSEIIKKSNYNFKWFTEARFDKIYTDNFIKSLYQGGCRGILFGLESGSQRVQNAMRKGYDLNICKKIIQGCRKNGLYVYITLMVGFPTEKAQDVFDTIKFISDNNRYIFHAGVSHFGLRKDTVIYNFSIKYDIKIGHNKEIYSTNGDINFIPGEKCMSIEESMFFYNYINKKLESLGLSGNEPDCHLLIRVNNNERE